MSLQASACRKNGFLMIKGHACKIVEMSTSKTGKHGHAKVKFTAVDIFDNSKHEMIESSTHNVDVSLRSCHGSLPVSAVLLVLDERPSGTLTR